MASMNEGRRSLWKRMVPVVKDRAQHFITAQILLNGVNKIKQRIYNDNIEGPWLGDVEEWRQVP
jgi:hypothetical protein